jgi:hypothetical protein
MDGEPSSSPANIGSKARGPSTLAKKNSLICHQHQVLVLLPHDEGTIFILLCAFNIDSQVS